MYSMLEIPFSPSLARFLTKKKSNLQYDSKERLLYLFLEEFVFIMKLLYTVYFSIYKSVGRFLSLNS